MTSELLVSRWSDDPEDEEKQVDDVQVEVESSEDVLLRVEGVLVLAAWKERNSVPSVENDETGWQLNSLVLDGVPTSMQPQFQ